MTKTLSAQVFDINYYYLIIFYIIFHFHILTYLEKISLFFYRIFYQYHFKNQFFF